MSKKWETREPSYTIDSTVKWCRYYGKQCRGSWKKKRRELPYDPDISLLDIFSKEHKTLVWKHMCTLMFIITLFMKTKIWNQAKWPSVSSSIKQE